jgi:hypothetical protein
VFLVDGFTQNKSPFACASGDWFGLSDLSAGKASPNDIGIIIIIVVIIGEVQVTAHHCDIIAQEIEMETTDSVGSLGIAVIKNLLSFDRLRNLSFGGRTRITRIFKRFFRAFPRNPSNPCTESRQLLESQTEINNDVYRNQSTFILVQRPAPFQGLRLNF